MHEYYLEKIVKFESTTLSGGKIIIQGCYVVYVYIYGNHGYFISFFKMFATAIFCC